MMEFNNDPNLDTKLFVRVDQETLDYLTDEADKLKRKTGLPKVGASTVARNIIVAAMTRSKRRKAA